jgi:cytochrome c-type biogenesis protein CcmE
VRESKEKKMRKWIASIVSVLLLTIAVIPFTTFAGEKGKYAGKVSEISQENKSFKLTTTDKTWVVTWTEKTDFIFEGKKTTPDQLKNDVSILVIGIEQEGLSSLEAVIIAWGELPGGKDPGKDPGEGRQTPMLFGKMSNLNIRGKSFSIQGKDPKGTEVTFTVNYKDETKFVRNKQLAKPEDFKDGEEVTVAGKIDPDKKTIEAILVVLGKVEQPGGPGEGKQPPMIFGIISRFNYEGKAFQLKTKDPKQKDVVFEVYYNKETKFFKDKKQVLPSDFKIGDEVTVAGKINSEKKVIEAILVVFGKVENPGNPESPAIKWDKDSIIREKFPVFNEESIDLTFKTTINQNTGIKITVSEPWLQLKSDQAKLFDQKITIKIIGEKLIAWKTNTAVIKITFPEYPKLDKNIFVSVDAIGNIVVVKIGSNKASVNMKEVILDAGSVPLLKNGRTFVGVRFMSEIVFNNKAIVTYDGKTQTVYFVLGSKKIELYIGKTFALVNGVKIKLDSPPFIQNGRTYIPLRFISENLDATVGYDAKSQTITIVYPGR